MNLHPGTEEGQWYTEKILPRHWERLAVVYVRQSTMQHVLEHQESTRLQYGLVRRAVAWGWPESRVLVIDDDLGRSGTSAEGRHGFQRLVAEVGLDHVGLILGVEMSRLARSSKDWHQLLEICALFGTFVFITMLALKVVREMRRALVTAFGTTDDDQMAVTVDEALVALARLCLLTYPIQGTAVVRLPTPDKRQAAILHALGTPLPTERSLRKM